MRSYEKEPQNRERSEERFQRKQRRERQAKMRRRRIIFFLVCLVAVVLIAILVGKLASGGDDGGASQTASVPSQPPGPTARPLPDLPPASEQNNLVKLAEDAKGAPDKKICYLTFDDGPTEQVTPRILDTLKQYNVKATFFMMGKMIDANRDLAKRVYEEGHLLAGHSYSHDYDALYATGESFMAEVNKAHDLIKEITGQPDPFKIMRFPGGGYNAGDHAAEKQTYKELLKQNGFYYADWNALNGDAEGGNRSAEQLLARIKQTAVGNNIVVLMHDAAAKKTTADALPSVIEYLRGQGYEFRCLDEIPYYSDGAATSPTSSLVMQ